MDGNIENSQIDDERMFDVEKNIFLVSNVFDLFQANDFRDR